jgi:hypothetical protein
MFWCNRPIVVDNDYDNDQDNEEERAHLPQLAVLRNPHKQGARHGALSHMRMCESAHVVAWSTSES